VTTAGARPGFIVAPGARVAVNRVSVMPGDRTPGYTVAGTTRSHLRGPSSGIVKMMARLPETRYAKGPGGDIAYQVVGDGPVDLVIVPGWLSHVDLLWEDPGWSKFIAEFASFARVIQYDKLGTGASDPIVEVPTLESRADELHAVLDGAGSDRPAFFGFSQGGPISVMFAATYPQRVRAPASRSEAVAPTNSRAYPVSGSCSAPPGSRTTPSRVSWPLRGRYSRRYVCHP
jgi:pimeloyl-ACP methyl ester carboxylesterase